VFIDAPEDVLGSLALVVLARCYVVPYAPSLWHKVKDYLAQDEVKRRSQAAFVKRSGQVRQSPIGDHHDLRKSLRRVVDAYFKDGLGFKEPSVMWSRRRSHKRWGYWMEDYDVIVINRILDHPKVPAPVVDFIVYHELLHKKHGHINISGATESHHHGFNIDERRFEGWKEVEAYLEKIYKTKGRCLR
jgi:hypothetical protein